MVGIFIKTCKKDHKWLNYCLQSIEKYAVGFEGLCLLTDSDHDSIDELKDIVKKMPVEIVRAPVPKFSHNCQDGSGYIWMQNQKLLWHNYCKFEAVLQIDSDCVITDKLNINDYYTEIEDGVVKYKWWTRFWVNAGPAFIHNFPLEKLLQVKPTHEHMLFNGWLMTREATEEFHTWLKLIHGCDWFTYLTSKANPDWGGLKRGSSVYNAYGGFIQDILHSQQYSFIEGFADMPPIKQYWSYGGITPAIRKEIEEFLSI